MTRQEKNCACTVWTDKSQITLMSGVKSVVTGFPMHMVVNLFFHR